MHLARFDDFAELGASVSAGCRCQGRARQLFRAALAEAQRQDLHDAARDICRTLGYAMRESATISAGTRRAGEMRNRAVLAAESHST
ncbi:hypothetical protein [Azonexus sp. R2A61]|uniref:hypothetical protein n=1 Tax=Azonexus sp. R2A61 TaxID=2744443 RepID=UPI00345FA419